MSKPVRRVGRIPAIRTIATGGRPIVDHEVHVLARYLYIINASGNLIQHAKGQTIRINVVQLSVPHPVTRIGSPCGTLCNFLRLPSPILHDPGVLGFHYFALKPFYITQRVSLAATMPVFRDAENQNEGDRGTNRGMANGMNSPLCRLLDHSGCSEVSDKYAKMLAKAMATAT
ncbi:hypothetical protein ALC53_02550 [Atta colombica]|uniref:Uncharacterized protein n=1 Tax=Atta colombica TaxID=520822 RepID=A0A195BRZ2_9HYME|nr:hypothetical protein ALC53_02550 [Atta colombica]